MQAKETVRGVLRLSWSSLAVLLAGERGAQQQSKGVAAGCQARTTAAWSSAAAALIARRRQELLVKASRVRVQVGKGKAGDGSSRLPTPLTALLL